MNSTNDSFEDLAQSSPIDIDPSFVLRPAKKAAGEVLIPLAAECDCGVVQLDTVEEEWEEDGVVLWTVVMEEPASLSFRRYLGGTVSTHLYFGNLQ